MAHLYWFVAARAEDVTTCSTVRRHSHHQLHSESDDNVKDKQESEDDFRFRRRIKYPGMIVRRLSVAAPPPDECNNHDDVDEDEEDVDRRLFRRDRPEVDDAWRMSTDDTARAFEKRRHLHHQSVTEIGRSSIHTEDEEMLEQGGGHDVDDDDDYMDRTDDSDEKRSPSTNIANVTTAIHAQWPLPYLARPALTGMMAGNTGKLLPPYVQFPSIMAPPRESNVKLAAIDGTEVAVAQFTENNVLPADMAALNVVLWNLHQQQMFQMHMLLQLQQQIVYSSASSPSANTPGGNGCHTGDLPETAASASAVPTSCSGQPLVSACFSAQSAADQASLPSGMQRHQLLQHSIHQQPLTAMFTSHSATSTRPFGANPTARYNDISTKPGVPERDDTLPQSSMPTSSSSHTASTPSVVHMSSALGGLMSSTQQPLQLGQPMNSAIHSSSQSQLQLVTDSSTASITTCGDYVTVPPSSGVGGLGAIPPMLAMIDMSLGRLEQQQKQSSEGIYT